MYKSLQTSLDTGWKHTCHTDKVYIGDAKCLIHVWKRKINSYVYKTWKKLFKTYVKFKKICFRERCNIQDLNRNGPGIAPCSTPIMLAWCAIQISFHIGHLYGKMVFAKALLCLGQCPMWQSPIGRQVCHTELQWLDGSGWFLSII